MNYSPARASNLDPVLARDAQALARPVPTAYHNVG